MTQKTIYRDGIRFCRDDRTGYYLNSARRLRLHRYVWEKHNGAIPKGYHVHHIDHDKANNDISNLQLLSQGEHERLHGAELTDERRSAMRRNMLDRAIPAAAKWHGSEAGREWHRRHVAEDCAKLREKVSGVCATCGKPFVGGRGRKFCSAYCKVKFRNKSGVDDITKVCPACGREFRTNRYVQNETCSRSCANRYRRMKRQCA